MGAPKGHPKWGDATKPKQYKTPKELWEAATGYFDHIEKKGKWYKQDFIRGGDLAGTKVEIECVAPFTLIGLCNYLGIVLQTFLNYSCKEGYEEYHEVCARIKQIIEQHKFEGAAVGVFNAAIIARDLGLVDKKDLTSSDGTMSPTPPTIINMGSGELDLNHITKTNEQK